MASGTVQLGGGHTVPSVSEGSLIKLWIAELNLGQGVEFLVNETVGRKLVSYVVFVTCNSS